VTPAQQRELDLGYAAELAEREERRGLETRAAATVAALLVIVTGVASALSHIDTRHVESLAKWLLYGAAAGAIVLLLTLARGLAGGLARSWKRRGKPRLLERNNPASAITLQDEKVEALVKQNGSLLRAVQFANLLFAAALVAAAAGIILVATHGGLRESGSNEDSPTVVVRSERGPPGLRGPTGATGPRGSRGRPGSRGQRGPRGFAGQVVEVQERDAGS
jgi:heme A synthase